MTFRVIAIEDFGLRGAGCRAPCCPSRPRAGPWKSKDSFMKKLADGAVEGVQQGRPTCHSDTNTPTTQPHNLKTSSSPKSKDNTWGCGIEELRRAPTGEEISTFHAGKHAQKLRSRITTLTRARSGDSGARLEDLGRLALSDLLTLTILGGCLGESRTRCPSDSRTASGRFSRCPSRSGECRGPRG